MKYLLFISFESGLKHNALYESLFIVQDSLMQLVGEEGLNIEAERIPTLADLEKHLDVNDDYEGFLSNGTWYHIQGLSSRNYIKPHKNEKLRDAKR